MQFKTKKTSQHIGMAFGVALSYVLFTGMLYFIFTFMHKTPEGWTPYHFILLTLIISLSGFINKRWLA